MTGGLARLLADAPDLGRLFFCDVRVATTESDLDQTMSHALALAERVQGAIETLERREWIGNVLVQALHGSGGIAQITVRRAGSESLTVEVDGDHGSLRLDEFGRLLRHDLTSVVTLVDAGAASLRDLAALRTSHTIHKPSAVSASHVIARSTN